MEPYWRSFLSFLENQDVKTLDKRLQLFLTHDEIEMLELRYQLIRGLLQKEKPQREIAKDLKVSISTLTRGANMLKITDDSLKKELLAHYALRGE